MRHWKAEAERQAGIAQVYNHSSANLTITTAAYVYTMCMLLMKLVLLPQWCMFLCLLDLRAG